jgi:hypothetical protein
MDVFLLSGERSFSTYQAGEQVTFSGGFTATDITSINRTVSVPTGSYFVVFDNTPVFGGTPEEKVTATFEITVSADTDTPTETETSNPPGENNAEIVADSEMPKIRKVTDNFGHSFVWDPEEYHSDATYATTVTDEIVVSDATTVTLTVEEIWADPGDTLRYSYVFGAAESDHPDNTGPDERVRSNTHRWNIRRSDYADEWRFSVYLRNGDEIQYQNDAVQSDFKFSVHYTNLVLD